jgi:superfamily I DNA/RNA helicase/RecB family exonuclease
VVSLNELLPEHSFPPGVFQLGELDLTRHALMIGSPASGKTSQLRHLAMAHLRAGTNPSLIMALVPQRLQAAVLRDQLAFDLGGAFESARAQTLTGFAYGIISSQESTPKLITGPQQQNLLLEIAGEIELPSWLDARARSLPKFGDELRAAVSVCQEFDITPEQLDTLSKSASVPEFEYLSRVLRGYRERASGLDAPAMLHRAAQLIEINGTDYEAILIDDAQELTPAGFALITALGKTAPVQAFADPDASVLGFRAASALELVAHFESMATQRLQRATLSPSFDTHPAQVAQLLSRVNSRLQPARAGTQRRAVAAAARGESDSVVAAVFDSLAAEADWLATQLRTARVGGVPWSEMAIVARTRKQLEQLAEALTARSVPCQISGSGAALSERPATRSLLELALFALRPEGFQQAQIEALLTSPFGGFDSISLRRLKRQLRFAEHTSVGLSGATGARTTAALLLEGIQVSRVGEELASPEGKQLKKLAELLAQARTHSVGLVELLSTIWQTGGLADLWRSRALSRSDVAAPANRDLDAVLALFAAAERFEAEGGRPLDFIESQLSFAVAEDTLARRGQFDSVDLTTAAGLHRGYRLVALPRLQDGIWPNLKPRNSLFRANRLDAYLRTGEAATLQSLPPSEFFGELRMLYRAIGATRERLLISGMQSPDESPSQFFALLLSETPKAQHYRASFDLRRMVGELRWQLSQGAGSAAALAALSEAGAAGAHPRSWLGLAATSDPQPLFTEAEQIAMRPSQLAKFERCPLHWFVSAHGGDGSGFEANLGTLIHEAFELTDGSLEALGEFIDANFTSIDFDNDWHRGAQRRRAQRMILSLAEYVQTRNRETALVEAAFEFVTGRLKINGKVDLVEKHPDGSFSVADVKTGVPPTTAQAAQNRQLALYQLAVGESGLVPGPISGARIISVGGDKLRVLEQPALEFGLGDELKGLLEQVTEELSSPHLTALVSEHCSSDSNCQLLLVREVNE